MAISRRQLFAKTFGAAIAAVCAPTVVKSAVGSSWGPAVIPGVEPLIIEGTIEYGYAWKRILNKEERILLYNSGEGLEYPFSPELDKLMKEALT